MSPQLSEALENLQAALSDELGSNAQVRDCAFEVIDKWNSKPCHARTPAVSQQQRPDAPPCQYCKGTGRGAG